MSNEDIAKKGQKRVDDISKGKVKIERKKIVRISGKENPYLSMDSSKLGSYVQKAVSPINMTMSFVPNGASNERYVKSKYFKLIKRLIYKEDKQVMEALWRLRNEILGHRIIYEVTFYSEGRAIAQIKCYKMALEGGQDIVDFFHGQVLDENYSDFITLVKNFETRMKQKGYGNVGIVRSPTGKFTVDNISLRVSIS